MTKKKEKVEKAQRRESPSGYHYYSLYRECPRKWFLKYVCGLQPRFTAPALIRGGIMHDATEHYFKHAHDLEGALETISKEFHERTPEFEKKEKIPELCDDTIQMFTKWHEVFQEDPKYFKLLEVEKPHEFLIGPNKDFLFTVRMDRVFEDKETRSLIVRDTKTTGWAIDRTFQTANCEDQMTAYLWAASKLWPQKKTRVAELDIVYKRSSVVKAERWGPIYRSNFELARFELELFGLINEVTQKFLSLEKFPEPILFPRSGRSCGLFGCEYEPLCRTNVKIGSIPIGFHRDPWYEEETRLALTKAQESFNMELIAQAVSSKKEDEKK